MARYIMLGAGGHARVLADALRAGGVALSAVASPDGASPGGMLSGLQHLRRDDDIMALGPRDIILVNGVGSVGRPKVRCAIFDKFRAAGFTFASVVHPAAVIAAHVEIKDGAQVMAGAIVQTGARIGANAIINTGAIVDHDTCVGDHAHVAPGACLAGDVVVGRSAHIGAGASVIQGRTIGDDVIVAAGAVVTSDVPSGLTVAGVPARDISRHGE